MKVALCLCGFARKIHSENTLRTILKTSLPPEISQLDIFYWCPTKLDSNESTLLNQQELVQTFQALGKGIVKIDFFDYEPTQFYKKIMQMKFPLVSLEKANPTHSRRLSDIYNRSNTVRLAYEYAQINSISYDWVIVTRNDLLPNVKWFGIQLHLEKGLYNYRTCPYTTSYHQVNPNNIPSLNDLLDTEDRAFFGSPEFIFEMRNFYESIDELYFDSALYTEVLHTLFFYKKFGKNICRWIPNSNIELHTTNEIQSIRTISEEELKYYRQQNYE